MKDHIGRDALLVRQALAAGAQRLPEINIHCRDLSAGPGLFSRTRFGHVFSEQQLPLAPQQGARGLLELQGAVTLGVGIHKAAHDKLAQHRAPLFER